MGYRLEQLLRWCSEDRLIEGFQYNREDKIVRVTINRAQQELPPDQALVFLRKLIRARNMQPARPTPDLPAQPPQRNEA